MDRKMNPKSQENIPSNNEFLQFQRWQIRQNSSSAKGVGVFHSGRRRRVRRTPGQSGVRTSRASGRQGLFNHNNTDHSIYMGLRAADAIAQSPDAPADPWYDTVEEFKHFRIVD